MALTFATHDIVPDSPTNTFATLNVLANITSNNTFSEGNLKCVMGASYNTNISTIGSNSGKWYFEIKGNSQIGVVEEGFDTSTRFGYDGSSGFFNIQYNHYDGTIRSQNVTLTTVNTWGTSNVVGCYLDCDNGRVVFYKDGTREYTYTFTPTGKYYYFAVGHANATAHANFGQDPSFGATSPSTTYSDSASIGQFNYKPVDSGGSDYEFYALCTANLPDPAIDPAVDDLPEDYFKAVKYDGNNSTNPITVGFKSDLVWIKCRTDIRSHSLVDSVRGFNGSSAYVIQSESTAQQWQSAYINSLDANGFTVSGSDNYLNNSSHQYVAWCFRAGGAPSGSTSTTGSAKRINTSGTQDDTSCSALASAASTAGASNVITPTLMSINQKAGFSIVKYTGNSTSGATLPHGLSQRPDMVILKNLDTSAHWKVWHNVLPTSGTPIADLVLNENWASAVSNNNFRGIGSEVITLGDNAQSNTSYDYIMYCWHSVAGFSKFGSYVGTSTTDGTFVECGFRPAWVMIKAVTAQASSNQSYASWFIADSARSSHNPSGGNQILWANHSSAEGKRGDGSTANSSYYLDIDFLSNGFKLRNGAAVETNRSDTTYIYAAFAEQPFKYANAR